MCLSFISSSLFRFRMCKREECGGERGGLVILHVNDRGGNEARRDKNELTCFNAAAGVANSLFGVKRTLVVLS